MVVAESLVQQEPVVLPVVQRELRAPIPELQVLPDVVAVAAEVEALLEEPLEPPRQVQTLAAAVAVVAPVPEVAL